MSTASVCSTLNFKKDREAFFEGMIQPAAKTLMGQNSRLTEDEAIKLAAADILDKLVQARNETLDEAIELYEKSRPVSDNPKTIKPQYHPGIVTLANDLTVNGGVVILPDNTRSQSTNPDWFKDKTFAVIGPKGGLFYPSVSDIKKAVTLHEKQETLTDRQQRILQQLSDVATNMEKEALDFEEASFFTRAKALLMAVEKDAPELFAQLESSVTNGFLDKESIDDYEEDYYGYVQEKISRAGAVGAQTSEGAEGAETQGTGNQDIDLGDLFDTVLSEELEKRGKTRTNQPGTTPIKDSAKSAVTNTASGISNAIQGLGELFGGKGRFSSGLTFDEETYAKAKPYFIEAVRNLQDAGSDIKEIMRAIVKMVLDQFGADVAQNMKPYALQFVSDYQKGEIDVSSTDQDLAPNSQDANTEDSGNGNTVRPPRKRNGSNTGSTGKGAQGSEDNTRSDSGDSIDPAALDRERGNQSLPSTEQSSLPSELPPGVDDSERGGNDSNTGIQFDGNGNQPADKLSQQGKPKVATTKTVVLADPDNIAATVPVLNSGQQADVLFAENRLKDNRGVLFTNGTGTGKTFSALGIIKRMVLQGKNNILIVTPSASINNQWMDAAAKFFQLPITLLDDTKDAGKGVNITTYANFGVNQSLVNRDWDMIVTDEAHKLLSNEAGDETNSLSRLRGITHHERGFFNWFNAKYADIVNELSSAKSDKKAASGDDVMEQIYRAAEYRYVKAKKAYDIALKQAEGEYIALKKSAKSRVVFLSATPFAYVKSIDYAEGYLFDYGPKRESSAYNAGDSQQSFMMQHFGYRMRTNKLTRPEADVDTSLMERQFNTMLRKTGALSFRGLDVDFDYDRQFILVESAIGSRIDEAMEWIRENKYRKLSEELEDKFDYLQRRYLLESIKANEAIPVIKDHLKLGRKVILFHDYKKGGATNPFMFSSRGDGELKAQIEAFNDKFSDIIFAFRSLPSPIDAMTKAFGGDALIFNGSVSDKERGKMVKQFNDDNSGKNLIVVQSASAKEGVSFHDTTGKHQRVLLNIGLPTAPTTAIQQEGRIYRVGQASDAILRYMNTGTNWERWAFASTIAQRASTAENLAAGEGARGLKDAFINAFEASDTYPAGHENEGKGGKSADKVSIDALTEFDRAKTLYFGQQKKTSRTKSAEGEDYFATPEPVGYMMAQISDARENESSLEPSAGHGAIARWLRDDIKRTAIEPSGELSSRLSLVFDGDIKRENFEDLNIINKYDTIVMNPPFGVGGKLAIEHIKKAIKHLRANGRIVALIPDGGMTDKRFDALMESEDAKGVYHVANISLPRVTFERAGTQVKTRIVVLDKSEDAPQFQSRDYSSAENIKELFERIENLSISPRAIKPPEVAAKPLDWDNWKNKTAQADAAAKEAEKAATESGVIVDSADKATFEIDHSQTEPRIISNAPAEVVITKKGKELEGIFVPDEKMAKAVDAYTYQPRGKSNGWFVRLRHVTRPSNTINEPKSPYTQTDLFTETRQSKKEAFNAGYQQDLFGDPLPDAQRKTNARPAKQRNMDTTPTVLDTGAPKGRYATRTALHIERTRNLGADTITNPKQLAQAISYLGNSPVEYFDAVVTDDKGKPLAIVGTFKGEHAGASVYPAVVVAEAFRVEGAAHIWFTHNHPGGLAELSQADRSITRKLKAAFDGSGITAHGIIATTPKGFWVYEDPETFEESAGRTSPSENITPTPVIERIFTENSNFGEGITNPEIASAVVPKVAQGQAGLVLMDNQHAPVAFLPISAEEAGTLKGNGRMDKIYRALSVSNSTASMLYDPKSEFSPWDYQNLGEFLKGIDTRFLDVLRGEGDNIQSLSNSGLSITRGDGVFYSKRPVFNGDSDSNRVFSGTGFTVIKNPTRARAYKLAEKSKHQELRGVFDKQTGNFYIADANLSLHDWIVERAGLPLADKYNRYEYKSIPKDAIYNYPVPLFSDDTGFDFYSKTQPKTNGFTVDQLKEALPDHLKSLLKTGKFKVITADEAASITKDEGSRSAAGFYDTETDTTYFVADNIDDSTDLNALALHEVGVHAMQLGKSDTEFQAILKQLEGLIKSGNAKAIAAKAKVPKGTRADHVSEETLANLVMDNPELPISKRFVAWMKNALRKLGQLLPVLERVGFVKWANSLTTGDMVYMAQAALRSAQSDLMLDAAKRKGSRFRYHSVWHGSPHNYDKFDSSKIGTGEGAQAFGFGLYFTDAKDIAEYYRDKLQQSRYDVIRDTLAEDTNLTPDGRSSLLSRLYYDKLDPRTAVKLTSYSSRANREYIDSNFEKVVVLAKKAITDEPKKGKLYQVELAPEQDEYLDWDKPLSEQSEKVKSFIRGKDFNGADVNLSDWERDGNNLYSKLARDLGGQQSASDYLHSLGIRGIRYKAEGGKSDANNYVIFSDEDVSISAKYSIAPNQKSPMWRRWFAQSKMVKEGKPIKFYHGSQSEFTVFDKDKLATNTTHSTAGLGHFFTADKAEAQRYGEKVHEVYLSIQKPFVTTSERLSEKFKDAEGAKRFQEKLRDQGFDGVYIKDAGYAVAFDSQQVKLTSNENPSFASDIRYSKMAPVKNVAKQGNEWLKSFIDAKKRDTMIYNLQDRFVDLKRQMEHAVKNGGEITEDTNPYLKEELYHQRTASRIKEFYDNEVNPLLEALHDKGVKLDEFQRLLHARHAPSRNAVMSMRNPNQEIIDAKLAEAEEHLMDVQGDPTATRMELSEALAEYNKWRRAKPFNGTEEARLSLSGMTNTEARSIVSQADPALIKLADKVDKINNKTLDLLLEYGMETEESVKALKEQWQHYVPLHRDEAHPDDNNFGHPIGRGFSVRGSGMQSATGSNAEVTNILAHITAAREQMLRRGEKNQVSKALADFVKANPDEDFATVDTVEVDNVLGDDGLVRTQAEPLFKRNMADNVVMYRVEGKDHAIVFNDNKPETVRLAMSLKNLDGANLDAVESLIAKGTRWFSRVNTQYNLVFGIINLMRDTQAMALNLTNTPLQGKQGSVIINTMPEAFKAIAGTERGWKNTDPKLKAMYDRFNKAGGTTGYAQMFDDIKARNRSIEKEFAKLGAGHAMRKAMAVGKFLTDFNTIMENSTRLAVFISAVNSGLSDAQAASLAKNITVNFNRKGAQATKIGAFYAFFNASAQGSAKLIETLSGPKGREIMAGAALLGAASAVMGMMMMGDDDWEKIPEFVRERSLIIPTGESNYISIPMPLGFHLFPNIGRKAVEAAFGSNRVSKTKRMMQLAGSTVGAFNPLGGSDLSDFIMPTVLDPALALWRNKDWTGHSIYREDFNSQKPTPGFTRTKDTATTPSKWTSKLINSATGGTDYKQGAWSPTPDQIDYVFGQLSGGTGREFMKAESALSSLADKEEVPLYKTPLVGRLFGETSGNAAERNAYYDNIKLLNEHRAEVDGLRKEGKTSDLNQYLKDNPETKVLSEAKEIEKAVNKLNDRRKTLRKQDQSTASIDLLIGAQMKRLNDKIAALQ